MSRRDVPRLLYGFLSASIDPVNIKMPWGPSDRDGLFKMNYSKTDAERENLIFWAKTNKGERVMDFNFGLDARRYIFEPAVTATDKILNNAREQLGKYFSHLVVEELRILSWEDDNSLTANTIRFILKARLKNNPDALISVDEVIS